MGVMGNVNPGLINPRAVDFWEGTIYVSNHDYWGNTFLIDMVY